MRDITHTDLELLYQLADGIDGEDVDPARSTRIARPRGGRHTAALGSAVATAQPPRSSKAAA